MNILLLLPILIPFLTAIACLVAWRRPFVQRIISLGGAVALFLVSIGLLVSVWRAGIQAMQIGNWVPPFGITLAADTFSAIMVVMAGTMGFAAVVYSLASIGAQREAFGYYPLFHILLMGVCGAFLTGDMFNLYVWFEVMLIASFVLMGLGGEQPQFEGGIKYVTLNLMSSALFLAAVGILYSLSGTLNMADLALQLRIVRQPGLVTAVSMLFLVAFGIKSAMFPLFFWLPASYHTPPVVISAVFAGLLTKVGVYSLTRVFTLLFAHDPAYTHSIILWLAALTMITGVLGAVAQSNIRRLLSFHIVSQIGYLLMGLGLFTTAALAGTVFFMVHVILAKSTLFLVSGVVERLRGTSNLKYLGGLHQSHPGLAVLFLIPALSLAGIPPLPGFFAKLALANAGLISGQFPVVAAALGVSALTLFSMVKIWTEAFWKAPPPDTYAVAAEVDAPETSSWMALIIPIVGLCLFIALIGLGAEPLFALANRAAEQLMNPTRYIEAVMVKGSS